MNKILKVFHTIKYLKFAQIISRISRQFIRVKFEDPNISQTNPNGIWRYTSLLPTCHLGGDYFKFLNEVDTVTDWNDPTKAKLWLYNLHYFDDLNREGWQDRTLIHSRLINSWIAKNPLMFGNGWEPYPISLRSVNWIKWFLSGNMVKSNWLTSLHYQVQALDQQLEYHLLGNHLFANAKALVFAGCFFKGSAANAWLVRGLNILDKELPEQILADGGNFELSPMYHNIILADLLDLYQLCLLYPDHIPKETKALWKATISKMLEWAEIMKHPDGGIAFFNDSAFGIAPKVDALHHYARLLDLCTPVVKEKSIYHLSNSGYVVIRCNNYKLVIDTARVGPDYIPGHAHADTLSFEMSVDGYRLFVNSGTSLYGLSPERIRQRKTESHNTVVVDGLDSSEIWSGFRVARRALPSIPILSKKGQSIYVECSHDGYMRLPGKVTHTRKWQLTQDGLIVQDDLSGTFSQAQSYYHFHPDVHILTQNSQNYAVIRLPSGSNYEISTEGAFLEILDATWHPEFGLSIDTKKLVLTFQQAKSKIFFKRV